MTRKDYIALADAISSEHELFNNNLAHAQFASRIARVLANDNVRFDRSRFIMACMPRAWVGTNKSSHWARIAKGDEY